MAAPEVTPTLKQDETVTAEVVEPTIPAVDAAVVPLIYPALEQSDNGEVAEPAIPPTLVKPVMLATLTQPEMVAADKPQRPATLEVPDMAAPLAQPEIDTLSKALPQIPATSFPPDTLPVTLTFSILAEPLATPIIPTPSAVELIARLMVCP